MYVDADGSLVHMALHDMSVQAFAREHRTLQIDHVAHLQFAEVGAHERLLHGRDDILAAGLVVGDDRQAHAVVRDGLVDGQRLGIGVAESEMFVALFLLNLDDWRHGFYYT